MSDIEPWNICMKPNICANCSSSNNGSINTIHFGRLYAVFCCDDIKCCNIIKNGLIQYINKTKKIPLYGLLNDNDRLTLDFYRESQKAIWKGTISCYADLFSIYMVNKSVDKNFLSIILEYTNNESKISPNAKCYERSVALDNIIFHNKDFYNNLLNCKNLFNSKKVVVSYSELSSEIHDTINMYNDMNKNKQSFDFKY